MSTYQFVPQLSLVPALQSTKKEICKMIPFPTESDTNMKGLIRGTAMRDSHAAHLYAIDRVEYSMLLPKFRGN